MSLLFWNVAFILKLFHDTSGTLSKCCPMGSSLQKDDDNYDYICQLGVPTPDLDIKVSGHMTSFTKLERQGRINIGMPACPQQLDEVFPEWDETYRTIEESPYYITEEGVFIVELEYYLNGSYCIDVDRSPGQSSVLVALYCPIDGQDVQACGHAVDTNCYSRCCHIWQQLDLKNKCTTSTGVQWGEPGGIQPPSFSYGFKHNPLDCPNSRQKRLTKFKVLGSGIVNVDGEDYGRNQYCLDNNFLIICKKMESDNNERILDTNNNFAVREFGQNIVTLSSILFTALNC